LTLPTSGIPGLRPVLHQFSSLVRFLSLRLNGSSPANYAVSVVLTDVWTHLPGCPRRSGRSDADHKAADNRNYRGRTRIPPAGVS
jgi:hypothetical protein